MEKIPVAILGSGNIGTDLLYKLKRSRVLKPAVMAGIISDSEGLARARGEGLETTAQGIDGLLDRSSAFTLAFDATTASAHIRHASLLKDAKKIAVDLTPAAIGPYIVPLVNLQSNTGEPNVNLVSCGGQATVPFVYALRQVANVRYAEIVATIASLSAGPGTRQNIDEFTYTTARGLESIGGASRGKAIIVLNPADPPIFMRNTIYGLVDDCDPEKITDSVETMARRVQEYVPGFRLVARPLVEPLRDGRDGVGMKVTLFVEVEGAGDYLPKYAGNLDIMTASAVKVGEGIGKHLLAGTWGKGDVEAPI